MKNISGKTLIFYTFQQKKQVQYNVIAFQPIEQPIKIKDVLQQLPFDLSEGKYHFRFKSEFVESGQKIVGWIDINNLVAKVPLCGGSVYVKILKVKSNGHNKLFNREKLAKVGIIGGGVNGVGNGNVSNGNMNQSSHSYNKIPEVKSPQTTVKPKSQVAPTVVQPVRQPQVKKPAPNMNLMQSPEKHHPKSQTTSLKKGQNIFQFPQQPPVFKSNQTPQQKLRHFKQTMAAQQKQKQNQAIARAELQQKIIKWGYSGAKTLNNLTTLLSTLHDIWPQWPSVSLTQLLKPEQVTAVCKKALIKTHPDKNRSKPFRQRYLSKRVFELLNDAKKASNA